MILLIAAPIRRNTLERTGPSATPPRPQAAPAADPPNSQPSPKSRPQAPPTSGGSKLQKTGSISSKFSSTFAGFLGKGKEAKKKEEEVEAEPEEGERMMYLVWLLLELVRNHFTERQVNLLS